jgi:hypothetical protein
MDMTKFSGCVHDTLSESVSCRVWLLNRALLQAAANRPPNIATPVREERPAWLTLTRSLQNRS